MKVVMNKLPAINMQVILNNFQYEIVTKEAPASFFCSEKESPQAINAPYHHA